MLSREENELLTRVDSGAPMGEYLRETCWFPVVIGSKLIPGGKPVLVRLMGEQYVAYRGVDGQVGLFDEKCPHRGASLMLARSEGNAIRCIFHGWKYHVDGTVLEVPTEPHNQAEFCKKVPLKRYAVREGCGIVWAWLGRGEPQPFPDFEFNNLGPDRTYVVRQQLVCNWVQDLEGGLDSAHVSILHQSWLSGVSIGLSAEDLAPTYEFEERPGGYRYAALRKLKNGSTYARVNQFVMPWFALICPEQVPDGDRLVIMSTPIDDTHCWHWMIRYNPYKTLSPSFANPADDVDNWPPLPPSDRLDSYGQDRADMQDGVFTGFKHINTEDFAVALSQGPIADRSKEFLNHGDLGVVRMRRMLINGATVFMKTRSVPAALNEILYPKIRASAGIIREDDEWHALAD